MKPRHYWMILSIVASMATTCDESPRGAIPTRIVPIELRLVSQPAPDPPPEDQIFFEVCLTKMDFETNIIASWRNRDVVLLDETAPNVFTKQFDDVPTGLANTMSVRDVNECRRNVNGDGTVITGVTINGTPIERLVPRTRVLTFLVNNDGTVSSPPLEMPTVE